MSTNSPKVTDKMMEQVYRYVPTLGHVRAIVEVAGKSPPDPITSHDTGARYERDGH